jgi:hypothetical protein
MFLDISRLPPASNRLAPARSRLAPLFCLVLLTAACALASFDRFDAAVARGTSGDGRRMDRESGDRLWRARLSARFEYRALGPRHRAAAPVLTG